MKTEYTQGFEAGMGWARQSIIKFLKTHSEPREILTLTEALREIERWQDKDSELGLVCLDSGEKCEVER
jgi:hypothetical protein